MNFNLLKELKGYIPYNDDEKMNVEKTIKFLQSEQKHFSRGNASGHITAGALVIDKDYNILLNHHKIFNEWYQFGGHCDDNPIVHESALREVIEESGIRNIEFVKTNIFDVDFQTIEENKKKQENKHVHYDINFLILANQKTFKISSESKELRWVSITEAKKLIGQDKALNRMLGKLVVLKNNRNILN